jgi:hypothetical protein
MGLRLRSVTAGRGVKGRLSALALVDALGTGLFTTVSALYFVRVAHLSPGQVGLGLSIAGVAGMAGVLPTGALADRVGSRTAAAALLLLQGLLFAGYAFVDGFVPFLLLVAARSWVQRSTEPVLAALTSDVVDRSRRVRTQALLRSLRNGGLAAGSLLAAIALHADTPAAYRALALGNAASFVVTAAIAMTLPASSRPAAGTAPRPPAWAVLRARGYLLMAAVSGLVGLDESILAVGLPLFLAARTHAPTVLLTAVFLLNTGLVVTGQVAFARGSETTAGAVRAHRLACAATALSLPLFWVAGQGGAVVAVAALLAVALLLSAAELWQAGGAWHLSYELAPGERMAVYQSAFSYGRALQATVGPSLVVLAVVDGGPAGLLAVAALLAVLAAAIGPAVDLAERDRVPAS